MAYKRYVARKCFVRTFCNWMVAKEQQEEAGILDFLEINKYNFIKMGKAKTINRERERVWKRE